MKIGIKVLVVVVFTFFLSCGDKDIVPQEGGLEIDFTEETIMINEPMSSVVLTMDSASQTFTFDATKFKEEPKPGEVILIAGELMRKVESVQILNGNYVTKTSDAALTDVIKDGEITWEITPEWSEAVSLKIDGEVVSDLSKLRRAEPIEFGFTNDGVEHKVRISPQLGPDGKINSCVFKTLMTKKTGGSTTVSFVAEGNVKLPNQKTNISISGSKLSKFTSENEGITADLEFSLAAAGGKSGAHSIKLPGAALSIPIRFIPTPSGPIPNPIPMSIEIGIQFVSQLTIPDIKSSATAKSKVSFSADAGFEYKGTTVETKGSIGKNEFTDGQFDSAANIGLPIDIQFGVAFPRIGLKIAGQELAYVHTGFTMGSSLIWGPLCKSGYVKAVVEGGYELKVLGQTIAADKKVFAEKSKEAKSDNCQ